jgi:hypothetical protein
MLNLANVYGWMVLEALFQLHRENHKTCTRQQFWYYLDCRSYTLEGWLAQTRVARFV